VIVPRTHTGTVARVLDAALARHPDAPAVAARHGRLSYAELNAVADRAAAVLWGLGVRPGDRVAASLPNDIDVVAAFHGAMRIGAVWVGVNQPLAAPEKAFILNDCGASVLLCDSACAQQIRSLRPELPQLRHVLVADPGDASSDWSSAMASTTPAAVPAVEIDPSAPAGIAYTSGTTGNPKGVVHSQHNLLLPGAVVVATRGYDETLRKGDCLPLTILNMMVLTTLLVAQAGGCCVVMDRRDPGGIAEWIRAEAVTVWNGVPAMLHEMVHRGNVCADDLRTLRDVWSGGGDCPEAIRDAFESAFGHRVHATYGLTEAPTIVAMEPVSEPHVAGSSGRVLPHLEVQVRDDGGTVLPPGETGEVCLRAARDGPWAGTYRPMTGYWRQDAATAEALVQGELRTGDVGVLDGEGRLFIRDRKKLLIVRGGANVYPAEVERVLHEMPGVAACAVIAVADERLGERVAVAVQPAPGHLPSLAEVQAHCANRLAAYKVPERLVRVDALPRNSMGKVQRRGLDRLFDPPGTHQDFLTRAEASERLAAEIGRVRAELDGPAAGDETLARRLATLKQVYALMQE
jgi:O-succinylbenzoic acid--CoA ligase